MVFPIKKEPHLPLSVLINPSIVGVREIFKKKIITAIRENGNVSFVKTSFSAR